MKNEVACSTPASHDMTIVRFKDIQMSSLDDDQDQEFILQQFIPQPNIHKIYAIGRDQGTGKWNVYHRLKRVMLPPLGEQFNSQNMTRNDCDDSKIVTTTFLDSDTDPFHCLIRDHLVPKIHETFGLTLFGVDVLIGTTDSDSSHHEDNGVLTHQPLYVIDVNYFPSFRDIPANRVRTHLEHQILASFCSSSFS